MSDDLLGCDCGGKGGMKSKESDEESKTPEDENDDSSDEEAKAGFISASQFDPEPVSRQATTMTNSSQTAKMVRKVSSWPWRCSLN
jgi:hypothetical protein